MTPNPERVPDSRLLARLLSAAVGAVVFGFLATRSLAPYFPMGLQPHATEAEFQAALDAAVPRMLKRYQTPGVVIATVANGAPDKVFAYGLADVARRRPMTPDTVFRTASLSKSLTAWGVLKLAETGSLSLDTPVARYLPDWPLPTSNFRTDGVTIRRLLAHTAGLSPGPDRFQPIGAPAARPEAFLSHAREDGGAARIEYAPGTAFAYSPAGYALIQMVIARRTGLDFQTFMDREILSPLGMRSSSFVLSPDLRARAATGYLADGRPAPDDTPEDTAADGLVSTAEDIARFVAAPVPDAGEPAGAGVISPATVRNIDEPPQGTPFRRQPGLGEDRPSLGVFVETLPDGVMILTNGGYDPGWRSRFYLSPRTGDGIVILANSDRADPVIAQTSALWATWRGFPPDRLIRAYRKFGLFADLVLGIWAGIGVAFAVGFTSDLALGRRGPARAAHLFRTDSLVEFIFAAAGQALWSAAAPVAESMPVFFATGGAVITFVWAVTVARALLPPRPVPAATPESASHS